MRYTQIASVKPFEGAPKINLPSVFGASPKKPFLMRIGASGERPIKFSAENLPEGLKLRENVIEGAVLKSGKYKIKLTAENALGKDEKYVSLEIGRGKLLLTPLMGFTSWNAFAFEGLTQKKMEYTAKRLEETGLVEYGYNYVNIDSGWQGEYGGKFDAVMPNEKFPDMKGFCDRLHKKGFKCGIYSTPMLHAFGCSMQRKPLPLGCTQGEPDEMFADERGGIGKIRKEKNNALQWADWGFDYLKYDWRPSDPYNAELMRRELEKTDRDFGYSVTVKARPEYHKYWEKYCSSYRCNPDSVGNFKNLLEIYESYFDFIEYVNRGHFFDLDMLDLGPSDLFEMFGFYDNKDFGYTEDEQLVVYSTRAFLASPIQISGKLDTLSDFEISMYCNDEIIAINQDALAAPAMPYMLIEKGEKKLHVLKRKLADGSYALAVFNFGETTENPKIYLEEEAKVRDVWAKQDLGIMKTIRIYEMTPHTVQIFKVSKA